MQHHCLYCTAPIVQQQPQSLGATPRFGGMMPGMGGFGVGGLMPGLGIGGMMPGLGMGGFMHGLGMGGFMLGFGVPAPYAVNIAPLNRVFGGPFNAPFSGVNGGTWAGPMRDICEYFKYDYLLIY